MVGKGCVHTNSCLVPSLEFGIKREILFTKLFFLLALLSFKHNSVAFLELRQASFTKKVESRGGRWQDRTHVSMRMGREAERDELRERKHI